MAKRWYFAFKTQKNHHCDVIIDDHNYSGDAIELNNNIAGSPGCPAGNPVTIQENDSDDILDNIREKTGYIRLRELTKGALEDMHPATNKDYEVFIFIDKPSNVQYNSDDAEPYTIFRGFIQAQSFENDYYSYRDEIELPIQSPLAILKKENIGTDTTVLHTIIENNFSNYYKYIVFPEITYSDFYNIRHFNMLNMNVAREILFPYNSNYNFGTHAPSEPTPSVYDPITIEDFLKKLCDIKEMIVHDVGQSLVFAKIGYTGNYYKYPISAINTNAGVLIGNGGTINNLSSFDFTSTDNKKSNIMPVAKITRKWTKYPSPSELDLTMCHRYALRYGLDYDGYQITSNKWNQTAPWVQVYNGIQLYNKDEKEILGIASNLSTGLLLSVDFPTPTLYVNKLTIEVDKNLTNVGSFQISVYSDGKYFNYNLSDTGNDDLWVDNEVKKTISLTDGKCEVEIGTRCRRRQINIYGGTSTASRSEWNITSMEVSNTYTDFSKYEYNPADVDNDVIKYNNFSQEEKTIDIDFAKYNDGQMLAERYQQLSVSQRKLKLTVNRNYTISELQLLLSKFGVSSTDTNNRVISTTHNVRDDEMTLYVFGNEYF